MRSAPPLAVWMNWLPSSIIAAHWAAISSLPSPSIGCSPADGAGAPVASASSARPQSAANASWSVSGGDMVCLKSSLDDDFLEQDSVDSVWCKHRVDAPGQFIAQPIESSRALEVGGSQLAQIGLESVHEPRQDRLDLRAQRHVRQLEDDLDLEVLHPIAAGAGQIDQHIRQFEKRHGLEWRLSNLLFLLAGK